MAALSDLLTSKIPPHAIEVERAVLGACLLEVDGLARMLELLQPSDFYKEAHRRIYNAMQAAAGAGQGIDLITVSEALKREAALEEIGGPAYLAQLVEDGTTLTQLRGYCSIVAEKARAREIIRIGTDLVGQAYENGRPSREIILAGAGLLEALARRAAPATDLFPAMLGSELLRLPIEPPTFHVQGWIPRRSITLLFGDSEAFKSWFAVLAALCVAAGRPLLGQFPVVQAPTLVISEENGQAEDKRRLEGLARGMGLDDLRDVPIHFASETGFSFDDPARYAALRSYVEKHGIQLVVLDSFVRTHRRKENDAGEMNALYLDRIKPLVKSGLSLILLHHRRKMQTGPGQQTTGDSDEIRGSGDIRAATHSAISLRVISDTQVLVKHNKTRGFRRQAPYVFTVSDTDDGAISLTWEGTPMEALDKTGACREAILQHAAAKGSFARAALEAELKGRFSKKVIRPVLDDLAKIGIPLHKQLRGRRSAVWYVYVPQGAEPASDGGQEEVPF